MNLLKKNFIGLYLFSLFCTLFRLLGVILIKFAFLDVFLVLVYAVLSVVIHTGFQWYILNIYRNRENEHIFKTIANSGGSIVLVNLVKITVMEVLLMVLGMFIRFLDGSVNQTGILENILEIYIGGMITVLFIFTEFIYYDNKDRGPLKAVLDSVKTTRKVYGKVLFIYSFILCSNIFRLIYTEIMKKYGEFAKIIFISAYLWMLAVYPICYVKICEVYESVKKEGNEINENFETYV